MLRREARPFDQARDEHAHVHRLTEDMDINCRTILDGDATVHEMGRVIFEEFLRVASGGKTKSELLGLGDHEFVPWNIGIVS